LIVFTKQQNIFSALTLLVDTVGWVVERASGL